MAGSVFGNGAAGRQGARVRAVECVAPAVREAGAVFVAAVATQFLAGPHLQPALVTRRDALAEHVEHADRECDIGRHHRDDRAVRLDRDVADDLLHALGLRCDRTRYSEKS